MASPSLAATCVLAALLQARAQINIMSPKWLQSQDTGGIPGGRILGSTTTIGAPFYGERVLGQLVWGKPTDKDQPHCTNDDYELPRPPTPGESDRKGMRLINIAMVKRGGCAFSTKVRVAAEKGAHAVIIVDKDGSNYKREQMNDVIVAEDSYPDDIHIPSIFICRQDGQILINAYGRGEPIVMELAWNVPTKSVVTVDQWMSSASSESLKFLKSFAPKRKILNQVLRYQPHFQIFSMGSGGTAQTTSKLCTDQTGKFCAEDPDGEGPVQGREVIEEDLRQLCLHDTTKIKGRSRTWESGDKIPEYAAKYWSYIELFQERCPITPDTTLDDSKRYGSTCSYALMQEVGLNEQEIKEIQECADISTEAAKKQLDYQRSHTAWSPRALRINGWRYSGILDAELVASAVCAGFSREPEECAMVKGTRDIRMPYLPEQSRGVSFATLFKSLFVVLTLVIGAFYLYKRYMQREMRATIREEVMLEVESQMAQYGKLSG